MAAGAGCGPGQAQESLRQEMDAGRQQHGMRPLVFNFVFPRYIYAAAGTTFGVRAAAVCLPRALYGFSSCSILGTAILGPMLILVLL